MPIGLVSDDDFDLELEDKKKVNVVKDKPVVVKDINTGRGLGKTNTPDEIRKFIAEELVLGASNKELSNEFGLSKSSISAYANGTTSTATYNKPNNNLALHINQVKEKISRKARRAMIASLNELTPDRIKMAKTVEIASIAKSMSGIIRDMEPDIHIENNDNRKQLVIYAPIMHTEKHYDAIDVQALDVE